MLLYFLGLPLACFGHWGERQLKRLFLVYLWRMGRPEIERLAESFYGERIAPILYDPVVEELRTHQRQHDYCVLVTASPSIYAVVIGRQLGFDLTIGTDVDYRDVFPLFPVLPVGNNKGKTKVDRLRRMGIIGEQDGRGHVTAYSDSIADLPMLQVAHSRKLVNPSRRLLEACDCHSTVFTLPGLWETFSGKLGFFLKSFFGIN